MSDRNFYVEISAPRVYVLAFSKYIGVCVYTRNVSVAFGKKRGNCAVYFGRIIHACVCTCVVNRERVNKIFGEEGFIMNHSYLIRKKR